MACSKWYRCCSLLFIISITFTLITAGCSGGGGGAGDGSDGNDSTSIVIDSKSAALDIADISINDSKEVRLTITKDSVLKESLQVDSVLTVIPDVDNRFPFGLSGKVSRLAVNPDNSLTATIEPTSFAEVYFSTEQKASIALNADNFIGVISPNATKATQEAELAYYTTSKTNHTGVKRALNGGVVVRNSNFTPAQSVYFTPTEEIELGEGGRVDLSMTVSLADIGVDIGDTVDDIAFVITGELNNLMLDYVVSSDIGELNELKAIVSGGIKVETALNASADISLGYYSSAWDEVEEAQAEMLGITGTLSGLDGKDKYGKFPLAGLVWSIPCTSTCTTTIGDTETAVNLAKLGGVIVWVYLDAKGRITLEGKFGSRVNSAEFAVGVNMPKGESLSVVRELTNSGNERLLEIPYIEGSVGFEARIGVALDIDIFAAGVRFVNTSAEFAGNFATTLEGTLSYGTYNLNEDWSWEGRTCIETIYGTGMILSVLVNAGLEIDAPLFDFDKNYSYYGQWPSEEDIDIPGWHGIDDSTWYTADSTCICFGDIDTDNDCYFYDEDCDDYDESINPSVEESCNDNIDNNCDGQINEDCPVNLTYESMISVGDLHTVGLKSDGTVIAVGDTLGETNVSAWNDIVRISASNYTIGLKSDGSAVVAGCYNDGRCDNIYLWNDVVQIDAGGYHALGLKSNNSVVSSGRYDYSVNEEVDVSSWNNIIQVSAGGHHSLGLRSDGLVVSDGYNTDGQCNVNTWNNMISVSAGYIHSVGLKSDGSVVAVGYNEDGRCDVALWNDIVKVAAGTYHTVGLKSDGSVVVVGNDSFGETEVSSWTDIVQIDAGYFITVGLKPDGSVLAVGLNSRGQRDVDTWDLIDE